MGRLLPVLFIAPLLGCTSTGDWRVERKLNDPTPPSLNYLVAAGQRPRGSSLWAVTESSSPMQQLISVSPDRDILVLALGIDIDGGVKNLELRRTGHILFKDSLGRWNTGEPDSRLSETVTDPFGAVPSGDPVPTFRAASTTISSADLQDILSSTTIPDGATDLQVILDFEGTYAENYAGQRVMLPHLKICAWRGPGTPP